MGNFYVNYTLRGPSQQAVADAFAERKAVIAPLHKGCVVAFDEKSDRQDTDLIGNLASCLSSRFQCPVLAILNHDDDILWYQLYENGELTDQYDSTPGYFDPAAEPSPPTGGNATKLVTAFGSTNPTGVDRVLRKSSFDDDGYVFAFERHAELMQALGLPDYGVGTAYASFERDELPEGLSPEDVIKCG